MNDNNFIKKLTNEKKILPHLVFDKDSLITDIIYSQNFIINSNLPNLENINGIYAPKGYGFITSVQFNIRYSNFYFSIEPIVANHKEYEIDIPEKSQYFSVLNEFDVDVPTLGLMQNLVSEIGIDGGVLVFTIVYQLQITLKAFIIILSEQMIFINYSMELNIV